MENIQSAASPEEVFGPSDGLLSKQFTDSKDPLGLERLHALFGAQASISDALGLSGIGRRFSGLDVSQAFNPEQAAYLIDVLSQYSIVVFSGQDLRKVSLAHFERFANHFGAIQPVPERVRNGVADAVNSALTQFKGTHGGGLRHLPVPSNSSAIYTVTNVEPVQDGKVKVLTPRPRYSRERESRQSAADEVRCDVLWHTDQDHERIACNTTMFLVHVHPTARDPDSGTWLRERPEANHNTFYRHPDLPKGFDHFHAPNPELVRLRTQNLPLNGETAFVDTVAAYEALPKSRQLELEKIRMIKYEKEGDDVRGKGFYCPLVRTNPRSGRSMIYSPIYGSRFALGNVPPAEIDGMSRAETMAFLNEIEAHCLQPQFRYDHLHKAGDLVIWDDYALLHCFPPIKIGIDNMEDARLYYRIATKGMPSLALPRTDSDEWLLENLKDTYVTPREILETVWN